MNEIRIVTIEDRDHWDEEHEDGGLPSQSWRYAWALSASGIRPKLAVVRARGARMLMPFFERKWMGTTDIATIYGLSGASIAPPSAAPLSLWREFAAEQGWVAGFIQLAVTTEFDPSSSERESVVDHNEVFLLDVHRRNLLESTSEIVRRKVRRATRMGVTKVEDRSVLAEALKQLYPSTMRAVGARSHYDFSATTLDRWAHEPTSVVLGAAYDGSRVEAVSIFCVAGALAEYHLNARTQRGRPLAAWLIWNAIIRLRANGVHVVNLGGGARPGDGVHRFKQRFNGTPKPLRASRQIYDKERYEELCQQAGERRGETWFPAYRATQAIASG